MKEWVTSIIGIMFSIAVIVFTAMRIVPVEVFCSLAAGAIVWFFKEKEIQRLREQMRASNDK